MSKNSVSGKIFTNSGFFTILKVTKLGLYCNYHLTFMADEGHGKDLFLVIEIFSEVKNQTQYSTKRQECIKEGTFEIRLINLGLCT